MPLCFIWFVFSFIILVVAFPFPLYCLATYIGSLPSTIRHAMFSTFNTFKTFQRRFNESKEIPTAIPVQKNTQKNEKSKKK